MAQIPSCPRAPCSWWSSDLPANRHLAVSHTPLTRNISQVLPSPLHLAWVGMSWEVLVPFSRMPWPSHMVNISCWGNMEVFPRVCSLKFFPGRVRSHVSPQLSSAAESLESWVWGSGFFQLLPGRPKLTTKRQDRGQHSGLSFIIRPQSGHWPRAEHGETERAVGTGRQPRAPRPPSA